jgi:hypothetical protein
MKKYTLLSLALFIAFGLTQCKKKSSTTETTEEPAPSSPSVTVANLSDLFVHDGVQIQTSSANATSAQTITVSGIKIEIPANAFQTTSSGTVTGNVTVSVKGIFTKSDIILSGAPANSAGKLIATKGCVKVSASQNSQTLRIIPSASVFVNVPEPTMSPATNLRRFYANKVSPTDTALCWKPFSDTSYVPVVFDTTAGKYFYKAKIDSVNWLNTGYVWDTAATKTTVTINVASMFNKTNTAIYISLNGKLVVGALYELAPNMFMITNIPVGKAVNIVGISAINDQYYSAVLPVTITSGFTQTLNLTATSITTIKSQLALLP